MSNINRKPYGRTYGTDPDDAGFPIPLVGEFPGEPTGLKRQNERLLTKSEIEDTERRALDAILGKLADIDAKLEVAAENAATLEAIRRLLLRSQGQVLYDGFRIAAPGVNTDIIPDDLIIPHPPFPGMTVALAVTVTLATASVFNYTRGKGPANLITVGFNTSVALGAGDGYGPFLIPVAPGDAVNFQVETDGIINQLYVEAIYGGVR